MSVSLLELTVSVKGLSPALHLWNPEITGVKALGKVCCVFYEKQLLLLLVFMENSSPFLPSS